MAASYKNAQIKITGPDLFEIRQAFKQLPGNIAARVIGAGLKRAAKPGENALKQITPRGPTGNLRRAIKTIVKRYPRDGAAVAVVGFVKAGTGASKSAAGGSVRKGPDRAYHQFWLEFGTRDRMVSNPGNKPYRRSPPAERRRIKADYRAGYKKTIAHSEEVSGQGGFIASSFNRLGPFNIKKSKGNGRVQTTPGYPKAFFRKSATPIRLPGVSAQGLVRLAFERSQSAISSNLTGEMKKALENGLKILEDQARRAAQMKDLGRHL